MGDVLPLYKSILVSPQVDAFHNEGGVGGITGAFAQGTHRWLVSPIAPPPFPGKMAER